MTRLARRVSHFGVRKESEEKDHAPIKTRLRDQTEQARAKGMFGAPTFFVGTEMFWGNDRLDDALLFAAKRKV